MLGARIEDDRARAYVSGGLLQELMFIEGVVVEDAPLNYVHIRERQMHLDQSIPVERAELVLRP
jgi:hypothetical protein